MIEQTKISCRSVTGAKKTTSISPKNGSKQDIKKEDIPINKKNKTDDNNVKKLYGRIPKDVKYIKERKDVLNKVLNILQINEKNNTFYISELENDTAKKEQIFNLTNEIKQYFSCGKWVYFSKPNVPNMCTSLIKSILKDMNVSFDSVSIRNNGTNKIDKMGYRINP